MQGQDGQLFAALYRHEPHGGPSHSFTNSFGIRSIVLVDLYIGLNELRRHQLDGMPQPLQFIGPVMGTAACLHADQARRKIAKE